MTRFLILSWEDLFWDIVELGRLIKESGFKPDVLVAVARGGWVVGRVLSDLLEVEVALGLTIKFYTGIDERDRRPRIVQPLGVNLEDKNVLLVDDIVDTGETLWLARTHVLSKGASEVRTATPYVKPWARHKPDYYVKVVDKWVVFPYEYVETLKAVASEGVSFDKFAEAGLDPEVLKRLVKELNIAV